MIRPRSKGFLYGCIALALLAALSARFHFRLDLSKDGRYTLSPYTKQTLTNLGETLFITWYRTGNLTALSPAVREIEDALRDLTEASGNKVTYSLVNPGPEEENDRIHSLGIVPRQIPVPGKESEELETVYSGLLMEYGNNHRSIPFIIDTANLEYELLRQILDVTQTDKTQSSIQVLYAGEPRDFYPYVEPWLSYAGFAPEILEPGHLALRPNNPLVVIGSSRLSQEDLIVIESFLNEGGRAAFFVSGNRVSVLTDWKAIPKEGDALLGLLSSKGFAIQRGLTADVMNYRITMPALDGSRYEMINYPFWVTSIPYGGEAHSLLSGVESLQFFWPSPQEVDGGAKLLSSTPASVYLTAPYNTNPMAKPMTVFSEQSPSGPAVLISATESPNRIAVISDEYMLSAMIEYTGSETNLDFLVNVCEWLAHKDALLELKRTTF